MKTDDDLPKLPPDVPHYKNKWTSSDFFEKPYDCNEQESQYKAKKKLCNAEKDIYDIFCAKKLAEIPRLNRPTMIDRVLQIKEERLQTFRERFALRSTKRLNIPGFLPNAKLIKLQNEWAKSARSAKSAMTAKPAKNLFNSPQPAFAPENKEN
jgi:hypothetical protein